MRELIRKLVETYGPSGAEEQIRDIIRAEVEPLADEVRVDALGSLIVRKQVALPKTEQEVIVLVARRGALVAEIMSVDQPFSDAELLVEGLSLLDEAELAAATTTETASPP